MERKEAIDEAVQSLRNGEILLFPSDTIWGLSCDATNEEAVQKLIDIKNRPAQKSFIVLLNSDRMINQCIKDLPEVAWDLIDLSTRPTTLVLDDAQYVAPSVINQDGSLGIRMVKKGSINDVLHRFNRPIVSTSANFSGQATPLVFDEIDPELKEKVDYIFPLDRDQTAPGPSKLIRIKPNGEVVILRK